MPIRLRHIPTKSGVRPIIETRSASSGEATETPAETGPTLLFGHPQQASPRPFAHPRARRIDLIRKALSPPAMSPRPSSPTSPSGYVRQPDRHGSILCSGLDAWIIGPKRPSPHRIFSPWEKGVTPRRPARRAPGRGPALRARALGGRRGPRP